MTTFYEITRDVARALGYVHEGTTTNAGTTATLIDVNLQEQDHFFDGGVDTGGALWIDAHAVTGHGTIAASMNKVTDHSATVLTFTPAHVYAIPASVGYAVMNPKFPFWVIKQSVNRALTDYGKVEVSKTMLTTGEQQYSIDDDAAVAKEIRRVEYGALSSDQLTDPISDLLPYDDNWVQWNNWEQQTPHDDGVAINSAVRILKFHTGYIPAKDNCLRITYLDYHPVVSLAADIILDSVPRDWLVWSAVVNARRWQVTEIAEEDPMSVQFLNEAIANQKAQDARRQRLPVTVTVSRW